MNLDSLKQAELARLFGVDARQIRNYQRENPPLPSHGGGNALHYKWQECLEWRDDRMRRGIQRVVEDDPDQVDEKLERALLARAQRHRVEIENAKARGETITLDVHARAMEDLITPARINLLSLRAKLGPIIGEEASAKVEVEIHKILADLATDPPKEAVA